MEANLQKDTDASNNYTCSFIPEYVLKTIANSASPKVDDVCRSSIEATIRASHKCHEHRTLAGTEHAHTLTQQPLAGGQQTGTGKRSIYDAQKTDILPGKLVRAEGQKRTQDRAVNNAYDGVGIVLQFFKEVLGRNSLDDKGFDIVGSCHVNENGLPLNNAFWSGESKQIAFGDGDGIIFDYLTDSLDIVAHELTHGLIDFTAKLVYRNQSGALNESCADVFACVIEQWHQGVTVDDADWLLGQTMFPVAFRGVALRSVKNPGSAYKDHEALGTDSQPKHMRDLYTGPDDLGGVHINSGIPNHAFYLAAKAVGGNSWERVGQVWYHTLLEPASKIPRNCIFIQFAKGTIEVAKRLFPTESRVSKAINDAWVEVGVL